MSFLQPLLLFALPLIGLPILIHLINRQRHRTVPWGAMMFLLDAKRLQRGMAKLRYWLIMAMRMLAIAGLIFAVSRPLASGWLGAAVGSQADTTYILLDRSASMQQQEPLTGVSKQQTALHKLVEFWETTGGGRRVMLVESTLCRVEEMDSVKSLLEPPTTTGTDAEADIPRMLSAVLDHLTDNNVGRADIWIASDLRENDWQVDDGRWAPLRRSFSERDGIRFHLLAYAEPSPDNLSIAVRNVRKRQVEDTNELVLDVILRREGASPNAQSVPIEFVINGARSVLTAELDNDEFVLQGHVIPLDVMAERGWGRVEIPRDANPADNAYYFVFADEPPRLTTVVSDDPLVAEPLRIAASAAPDPALTFAAVVLPSDRIHEIDWDASTAILWHGPFPETLVRQQLLSFSASGRPVIFFPPTEPSNTAFAGVRWDAWREANNGERLELSYWRDDSDLLANTLSGSALPVGKLQVSRYCRLAGPGYPLARFTNGEPLLLRADGDAPVYFCATPPGQDRSSLARDGVVLYVMLQRAIAMGAAKQGDAIQVHTGSTAAREATAGEPLMELGEETISAVRPFLAGAYQQEDRLVALNRPADEDLAGRVSDQALTDVFAGLDYHVISDQLGNASPLANEIWRAFLVIMAVALVVEAALCLG